MKKQSVRGLDVRGKRVLVRVDLNVPLRDGDVADDTRIKAALPTIQHLIEQGAMVVACSHLGRPKGKAVKGLSMAPVADRLSVLLRQPSPLLRDCVGREVEKRIKAMEPGQVLVLENLRFHAGEEENDPKFAAQLAKPVDLYVNDAFGAAHRAHASTEGVTHLLPSAAGLLLEREIEYLSDAFGGKNDRTVVISGGAKVSDKLGLLHALVKRADALCIGGAMANTFLLAKGTGIGASLAEPAMVDQAKQILIEAEQQKCDVLLPVDGVIAEGPHHPPRARPVVFAEETVPKGWHIFDVGPRTIENFKGALAEAKVAIWNGPMGLFEQEAFAGGTRAMAQALGGMSSREGVRTIVCGGETAQAVVEAGMAESVTHISTGGGAALELLEGRTLPGIAALPDVT